MIWIQWKLNGWILSWIFSNSFSILKGKQKHSIPMLRLVANSGQISSKRNPSGFFLPKPLAKKRCITLPPKATFNPTSPHPPIACAGAKELQAWMKKCWKFPVIRAYGATGKETKGAWVDICTRENIRTPHFIIQSRAVDHHTTRHYWASWDGFLLFWRAHHLAWFRPKSLPKSSHFPRSWKS